jgi:hypothetical protein
MFFCVYERALLYGEHIRYPQRRGLAKSPSRLPGRESDRVHSLSQSGLATLQTPVWLIPVVNLELRISPRIFEKIRNGPNGILRGLGETDS